MPKAKGLLLMLMLLSVVLYCDRKQGREKELENFGDQTVAPAPVWAQRGVLYEVFPRVYTAEGNFKALEKKLDYIKSLNVDIVWLMPIFPIGEKGRKGTLGSPYSVRDFRAVNPEYGTKEDFRELVKAIHQKGMKVILGIVPNHSSNDNVLMKEHPDWFMQDEKGQFTREVEDWSDVTDFNYDNPAMREYMTETFLYWVKEFGIDGYRCDVAGMVPYDFWKETIRRLKEVKSDIYMLAEWEDPKIILAGFNSDYDWTLYHLLKEIRKSEKRTAEAVTLIDQKDNRYPRNSLPMRFLENHDEQRSMQEFGLEAIEAYATFIFTAPGIPLIYAGQEMGETQKPSLFEKSTLDWANADTALQNMYRSLIGLRKQYSCLTEGKFIPLQIASYSGSAGAFLREDDSTAAVVVFNLQNKTAGKVIVTTSKEVRDRLRGIVFKNYKNAGDTRTFEKIYFKELLPYQALVYVAKKQ